MPYKKQERLTEQRQVYEPQEVVGLRLDKEQTDGALRTCAGCQPEADFICKKAGGSGAPKQGPTAGDDRHKWTDTHDG